MDRSKEKRVEGRTGQGPNGTPGETGMTAASSRSERAKRTFDMVVSGVLLIITAPLFVVLAVTIVIESRGGVFFRCDRAGYRNGTLGVLKFRKMTDRATGSALTLADDDRFTRVGKFLAATKLDELPQLWNVFRGDMSLVGPRPEDKRFARMHQTSYDRILSVRPGITGLSQLAFAKEGEILATDDPETHYVTALLPQKVALDERYASERTLFLDVRILFWTTMAIIFRREVAVNRNTLAMGFRRHTPNNGQTTHNRRANDPR